MAYGVAMMLGTFFGLVLVLGATVSGLNTIVKNISLGEEYVGDVDSSVEIILVYSNLTQVNEKYAIEQFSWLNTLLGW